MLLLHRKWGAIATVASKDRTRIFLTGVSVRHMEGGKVELAATDGARLLRVRVNAPADPKEFPAFDGLPRDDTRASAIIPSDVFQKTLAANKVKRGHPILEHVAVTLTGEDNNGGAAFGFTDLVQPTVTKTPTIEGPFPNYEQVIQKGEPAYTIVVNADYLAETLKAVSRMLDGRINPPAVTFRFYGKQTENGSQSPFRIDAKDEDGNQITAVVAPLRLDNLTDFAD